MTGSPATSRPPSATRSAVTSGGAANGPNTPKPALASSPSGAPGKPFDSTPTSTSPPGSPPTSASHGRRTGTLDSSPAGAKKYGEDNFGNAVTLSDTGTTLVVGARATSTWNSNSVAGAAFAYTYASGAWSSPYALTLAASANRNLGYAVSLAPDGNSVVVGMPRGTTTGASGGGAAIQYTRSGSNWTNSQSFSSTSTGANDNFGATLGLDAGAGHPVIGASGVTVNSLTYAGSAYTY